jgi:hypothetical protein
MWRIGLGRHTPFIGREEAAVVEVLRGSLVGSLDRSVTDLDFARWTDASLLLLCFDHLRDPF